MAALFTISTEAVMEIGDSHVSAISFEFDHNGSIVSRTYRCVEAPSGKICIGRTPSLNDQAPCGDIGGHLNGAGRVEFRCAVMSREHASLTFERDGKVYLQDLQTCHHGTTITRDHSEIKLAKSQPYALLDGDRVTFGKSVHKGGKVHEPLHARIRLYTDDGSPRSGSGCYRLGTQELYMDEDEPNVRDGYKKPFGSEAFFEEHDRVFDGIDLSSPHVNPGSPQSIGIFDSISPFSQHGGYETYNRHPASTNFMRSTAPVEVVDLTGDTPSPISISDDESDDQLEKSKSARDPSTDPENPALDFGFFNPPRGPTESPKAQHIAVENPVVEEATHHAPEPEDQSVEISEVNNGHAETPPPEQSDAPHPPAGDGRLEKEVTDIEARVDRCLANLQIAEAVSRDANRMKQAVTGFSEDLEKAKSEIMQILCDMREAHVKHEINMNAEVEKLKAMESVSTSTRKRKVSEMVDGEDSIAASAKTIDPVTFPQVVNAEPVTGIIAPMPKRRRLVTVSQLVMGAVAGSVGTIIALGW